MEDIFVVEFIDGELVVIDSDGRTVVRQSHNPNGSGEQFTESVAMSWWESNKQYYYKYPKIQSTAEIQKD